MRNYWKQLDDRMFDFKAYYDRVALDVPDNCRIAEVGVADGISAIYLAEAIINAGKKIDRFIMIDNCDYGNATQRNTIISNIIKSGIPMEFLDIDSLNASVMFPDNYFHHVFIDASHLYEPTKADIRCWWSKVMDDYWLAGHDYSSDEVKRAVDEVLPKDIKYVNQEAVTTIFEEVDTDKRFQVWRILKNWQISKLIKSC